MPRFSIDPPSKKAPFFPKKRTKKIIISTSKEQLIRVLTQKKKNYRSHRLTRRARDLADSCNRSIHLAETDIEKSHQIDLRQRESVLQFSSKTLKMTFFYFYFLIQNPKLQGFDLGSSTFAVKMLRAAKMLAMDWGRPISLINLFDIFSLSCFSPKISSLFPLSKTKKLK